MKALQLDESGDAKKRAPRNRTLTANASEIAHLRARLLTPETVSRNHVLGRTVLGDCFATFSKLPAQMIDVLILDPPYNLNKKFGSKTFSRVPVNEYTDWLRSLFHAVKPLLKPTATV